MAALTEEQELLKEQAKSWANEEAPVSSFRAMRDAKIDEGFDRGTWKSISEMGWAGILVAEEHGGVAMGHLTAGVVLEELGRQLTASPLFASAIVGATAVELAGSDAQKAAWLPRIADGSAIVTLAIDEGPRHAPLQTALAAEAKGDGFVLNGHKAHVLEGLAADAFVVVARTSGSAGEAAGLTLFLVDGNANGVSRTRLSLADSRGYANVELAGVEVGHFDQPTLVAPHPARVRGRPEEFVVVRHYVVDPLSANILSRPVQHRHPAPRQARRAPGNEVRTDHADPTPARSICSEPACRKLSRVVAPQQLFMGDRTHERLSTDKTDQGCEAGGPESPGSKRRESRGQSPNECNQQRAFENRQRRQQWRHVAGKHDRRRRNADEPAENEDRCRAKQPFAREQPPHNSGQRKAGGEKPRAVVQGESSVIPERP